MLPGFIKDLGQNQVGDPLPASGYYEDYLGADGSNFDPITGTTATAFADGEHPIGRMPTLLSSIHDNKD